jgi:hypothetical protein
MPRVIVALLAFGLATGVGSSSQGRLEAGAQSSSPRVLTADDVARGVRDRDTGRDSRTTLRMKLFDRHGRARERALTLMALRGGGKAGACLLYTF